MELFISPPPAARDALPTMATPLLPPSASSTMSAATASAVRTRAPPNTHDGGEWHFPSPLPLPSPLLLPPPQKSLVHWLVVASMPPPLVLSTLPPLLNAHWGPVASCPLAPLFLFASRSPAGFWIACCCVTPPRVTFYCAASSRVHPWPPLFVLASCLSCCKYSHRLHLSTRRHLATGCVVVVEFDVGWSHRRHIPSRHCHRRRLCCLSRRCNSQRWYFFWVNVCAFAR